LSLERILKRRRDADEAAVDDLRLVVLARLAAGNGDTADHPPAPDQRPVIVRRTNGDTPAGAMAHPLVGAEPQTPSKWLLVAPLEDPPAMAAEPEVIDAEPPAQAGTDRLYASPAAGATLEGAGLGEALIATEAPAFEDDPQDEDVDAADPEVSPRSRQGRRPARAAVTERRRADARGGATPVTSTDPAPVEAAACCPYCAVLLQRPPKTDDLCPRCGQRMIVRSVGARVAILAEAVLPVFEAERLNEERWAGDRDRWLKLARESGAGDDQVPQLAGELISEADVAATRAWYMSSVDRAFRVAQSDRQWEEAARIRYEQASVLSRIAASPGAPSHEVVRLHRDGLAADLQAIGEVARVAEVRGDSCCEACRVDDRRVAQIAEELESPTLPHADCPDGLCRCRWFLTARDQELLAALLRRQMGADRRTAASPDEPGQDGALSAIA
jgi:predicted RNA-binding Zn-ribbon protein involved in translation (DUF1610 family)